MLRSEIAKSASRLLLEFILAQYDAATEIEGKYRAGQLSGEEAAYWADRGKGIRRALKHLAETVTLLAPPEAPLLDPDALALNLDTIVICGEILVNLYIMSDQTHGVHPNDTVLTIHPEGALDYVELRVKDFKKYSDFPSRVRRDAARQEVYLPSLLPHFDLGYQSAALDAAFRAEFGFSYKDAIHALAQLIDEAVVQDRESFDVPFVRRDQIVDRVREAMGWAPASVERLLAGFTLTKEAMEDEGRVIYKPKQEHRALRRGFFEMPHASGPHLAWSRRMARECLFELMRGTVFQRCPKEWRAAPINEALAAMQNGAGDWFEAQVDRNMATFGALGKPSLKNGIGIGADRIAIPREVGEIDYLGFLPARACSWFSKTRWSTGDFEPAFFRDDISNFHDGRKPYAEQLRRKLTWVRQNLAAVCKGLSSLLPGRPPITATRLAGALVTLHPTYASYFIPDYPCVALSELMDGFAERGGWPYSLGVTDLS